MPDLTPEDLITAAFDAADRELKRQEVKFDDFGTFFALLAQQQKIARGAHERAAARRAAIDLVDDEVLDKFAYQAAFQLAVTALLTLGHFPFRGSIERARPQGNA